MRLTSAREEYNNEHKEPGEFHDVWLGAQDLIRLWSRICEVIEHLVFSDF